MAEFKLHLQTNDGKTQTVTAPAELPVRDFLTEVVAGMQLPHYDETGEVDYHLVSQSGSRYPLFGTLADIGVKGGDHLLLVPVRLDVPVTRQPAAAPAVSDVDIPAQPTVPPPLHARNAPMTGKVPVTEPVLRIGHHRKQSGFAASVLRNPVFLAGVGLVLGLGAATLGYRMVSHPPQTAPIQTATNSDNELKAAHADLAVARQQISQLTEQVNTLTEQLNKTKQTADTNKQVERDRSVRLSGQLDALTRREQQAQADLQAASTLR